MTQIPLWRGPSPGLLGWLMHREGLLGPRNLEVEEKTQVALGKRPVFDAECPRCSKKARIYGPLDDDLDYGDLQCAACEAGFDDLGDSLFSNKLYNDALAIVANHLGYGDTDAALETAKAELRDALPTLLRLDWPKDGLVVGALAALDRYAYDGGHHLEELVPALEECVRWRDKNERPAAGPTKEIVRAVQKAVQLRAARRIAMDALDRACLATNKRGLTSEELLNLEGEAMKALANVLDYDGALTPAAIGYRMKAVAKKAGERGPGIVAETGTGNLTRWMISPS